MLPICHQLLKFNVRIEAIREAIRGRLSGLSGDARPIGYPGLSGDAGYPGTHDLFALHRFGKLVATPVSVNCSAIAGAL